MCECAAPCVVVAPELQPTAARCSVAPGSAFDAGLRAAEANANGAHITCPYQPGSKEHADWTQAYNDWWDY
jgi:hypothetical protein